MRKKMIAMVTSLAMVITCFTALPVSAASGNNLISRVGNATKTVTVGNDFDLEVKKGKGLSENDIKWTSSNTSIVKYDDDDRFDDEMEFRAVKTGTAKVTAKNLETGGKIVYTIKVKKKSNNIYISRVGASSVSVNAGKDFELNVKKGSGLKAGQIKWTSSNTSIVGYDDGDRYGTEAELVAKKAGTVKVTAKNLYTGGKIVYTVKVKSTSGSSTIARVGNATKYVEAGDDLEIKVKKGSKLTNSKIKWTIGNTNLLRFEDGDNYGAEVELEAKNKTGTTKVTAHNLVTGGKIVYTVKVTPDYDD